MGWTVALMCYNEEATLAEATRRTVRVMRRLGLPYEILIVDDGSRDASARVATDLAAEFPEIRLIAHKRNRGVGAVLGTSYREARGDFVVALPADLQMAPEDLPAAMRLMPDADVVEILRLKRQDRWLRKVVSLVDRTLTGMLFGVWNRDLHWVKLYRRAFLQDVQMTCRTPVADTEVLIQARERGARVVQVTLPHHPRRRGRSRAAGLVGVVISAVELLWLWVRSRRGKI